MPRAAAKPELKYITKLPDGGFRLRIRTSRTGSIDEVHGTLKAAQKARDRHLDNAQGKLRPGSTLAEAWTAYEQSTAFAAKGLKTQSTRRSLIKPVLEKLGTMGIRHIDAHVIERYKQGWSKQRAPDSKRLELDALSATLNFAVTMHAIPSNPCKHTPRPPGTRKDRVWTPAEEGLLMQLSAGDVKPLRKLARFMLLVRALRCRPGELASALVTDLNLERRQVRFRKTKNTDDRTIPFSPLTASLFGEVMADELEDYPDSVYIFSKRSRKTGPHKGAPVPYDFAGACRDARTKYGVVPPGLTCHVGRHTGVTNLVEDPETRDLSVAAQMIISGHKTLASFMHYVHAQAERYRPELEASEASRVEDRVKAAAAILGIPEKRVREILAAKAYAEAINPKLALAQEPLPELPALPDDPVGTKEKQRKN